MEPILSPVKYMRLLDTTFTVNPQPICTVATAPSVKIAMVALSVIGNANIRRRSGKDGRSLQPGGYFAPDWPEEGTCPGRDRDKTPSGSEGTVNHAE